MLPSVTASTYDFSDLRAIYINCTLKRSPEISNTAGLMAVSTAIMRRHGVHVDEIRAVDHDLAPGVQADMTEFGFDRDDWPPIYRTVQAADILVIATPIWLGDKSSMCTRVIERLYANSGELNDAGQYAYYGKVGGVIVTGNEDGIKHVAMNVLYSLQHLGCVIPPQADAGLDRRSRTWTVVPRRGVGWAGERVTQRNTVFMTWNLMHLAAMIKGAGGIPAHGNSRQAWDDGARFDHPFLSMS